MPADSLQIYFVMKNTNVQNITSQTIANFQTIALTKEQLKAVKGGEDIIIEEVGEH